MKMARWGLVLFCQLINCQVTCAGVLQLVEGFLARFDDEVEQIKLKQSIGGNQKNRRLQHSARMDAIELTSKPTTT